MKYLTCFFLTLFILQLVSCATSSSHSNPTAANYNVALGLSYLKQNNVEAAKRKLLLALQQAPQDPTALDAMGYFLEQTDEPIQAKKYYLAALKLAPKAGETQNNYAAFLCRQGDYSKALTHFLLATQDKNYLHPAQAYENAGLCALKIPNRTLAKQYFQKALKADPGRKRLSHLK